MKTEEKTGMISGLQFIRIMPIGTPNDMINLIDDRLKDPSIKPRTSELLWPMKIEVENASN